MRFGLLFPPGTPTVTGIGRIILSPRLRDVASTIERFGRDIIPRLA